MSCGRTPRALLQSVGPWVLGRTLGKGAYGHVRVARHIITGREVACKILPSLYRDKGRRKTSDEMMDAIEAHKEVVILKGIAGANVPGVGRLEGVLQEFGWTFVFLTLYPDTASSLPCPLDEIALSNFFRPLLVSIDTLHHLHISHEDLKRSNILVDTNHLPVVVDFGFSLFNPYQKKLKSCGGTLDYSSPEKIADDAYHPPANDVWALGVLLLKLIGHTHPFHGEGGDDSEALRNRILYRQPNIELTPRYVSSGLDELVKGMLNPLAEERWTIPQILSHPFFSSDRPYFDHPLPPRKLKAEKAQMIHLDVLEDIAFLSFVIHEFHICETYKGIRERLLAPEGNWEQQWAQMFSMWRPHGDVSMDILDLTYVNQRKRRATRTPLAQIRVGEIPETPETPHKKPLILVQRTPHRDDWENSPRVPPRVPKKRLIGAGTGRRSSMAPVPFPIRLTDLGPASPFPSIDKISHADEAHGRSMEIIDEDPEQDPDHRRVASPTRVTGSQDPATNGNARPRPNRDHITRPKDFPMMTRSKAKDARR